MNKYVYTEISKIIRKKVTIVYVCERGGKTVILKICIDQSFSSRLQFHLHFFKQS